MPGPTGGRSLFMSFAEGADIVLPPEDSYGRVATEQFIQSFLSSINMARPGHVTVGKTYPEASKSQIRERNAEVARRIGNMFQVGEPAPQQPAPFSPWGSIASFTVGPAPAETGDTNWWTAEEKVGASASSSQPPLGEAPLLGVTPISPEQERAFLAQHGVSSAPSGRMGVHEDPWMDNVLYNFSQVAKQRKV